MDTTNEPRRKREGRARQRREARQRRREGLSHVQRESIAQVPRFTLALPIPTGARTALQKGLVYLRNWLWLLMHRTPAPRIALGVVVLGVMFVLLSSVLSGRVFPNVWSLGVSLGGMSVENAAASLEDAWERQVRVEVMVGDEVLDVVPPSQLGLVLDAATTATQARNAGLSGVPFGVSIPPTLSIDYGPAQNYLLSLTESVYIPPYEAGYAWRNGQLVGVRGRSSRELDVTLTLEALRRDPQAIIERGRLDLMTVSTPPQVSDPSPYLDEAYAIASEPFQLTGYDPFTNEYESWTVTRDEFTSWLAAGANSLTVREEGVRSFVDAMNASLLAQQDVSDASQGNISLVNDGGNNPDQGVTESRFIDLRDTTASISEAVAQGEREAILRIRYMQSAYTVDPGDNGYKIGRKNGLPFQMIEEANPTLDWNVLSINQRITIPSRDALLPERPVPHKRIIVDLQNQWLVAYDHGEIIFSWPISSGRPDAPTYPGIFQILSKTDVAYGSSYSLCDTNSTNCDQWEMYWFMGIYEVFPGLMNGFHGAVLLPNGAYLGGGGVNRPSTFGCVMSENDNAQQLYEWADIGTVVEIISEDFAPRSDLAREALAFIQQNAY